MASNESKDVSCQTVDNLTLINEEEIMGLVSLLSTLANLFLHDSYCFILFDLEITVNGNLILDLISEKSVIVSGLKEPNVVLLL